MEGRAFVWAVWIVGSSVACSSSPSGPTSTGGADSGGEDQGTADVATCTVTNFSPSPGLEGCFDCMMEKCCAEVQACDQDPDCVYCTSLEGRLDTTERCVDPSTFSVYPKRKAFGACQTDRCVSPCGAPGGTNCTPSHCTPSCPRHSSGCT